MYGAVLHRADENSSAGYKTLPYKGKSARREACPPKIRSGTLGGVPSEHAQPYFCQGNLLRGEPYAESGRH